MGKTVWHIAQLLNAEIEVSQSAEYFIFADQWTVLIFCMAWVLASF